MLTISHVFIPSLKNSGQNFPYLSCEVTQVYSMMRSLLQQDQLHILVNATNVSQDFLSGRTGLVVLLLQLTSPDHATLLHETLINGLQMSAATAYAKPPRMPQRSTSSEPPTLSIAFQNRTQNLNTYVDMSGKFEQTPRKESSSSQEEIKPVTRNLITKLNGTPQWDEPTSINEEQNAQLAKRHSPNDHDMPRHLLHSLSINSDRLVSEHREFVKTFISNVKQIVANQTIPNEFKPLLDDLLTSQSDLLHLLETKGFNKYMKELNKYSDALEKIYFLCLDYITLYAKKSIILKSLLINLLNNYRKLVIASKINENALEDNDLGKIFQLLQVRIDRMLVQTNVRQYLADIDYPLVNFLKCGPVLTHGKLYLVSEFKRDEVFAILMRDALLVTTADQNHKYIMHRLTERISYVEKSVVKKSASRQHFNLNISETSGQRIKFSTDSPVTVATWYDELWKIKTNNMLRYF